MVDTPKETINDVLARSDEKRGMSDDEFQLTQIREAVQTFQNMVNNGQHRSIAAQSALNVVEGILGMNYEQYLEGRNPKLPPLVDTKSSIMGAITMYYEQVKDASDKGAASLTGNAIKAETAMRTIERELGMENGREQDSLFRKKIGPGKAYNAFAPRNPTEPDGTGFGRGKE